MQAALEKHLLNFEFSFALQRFYKFFWHEFCDVYLESCKQDKKNNPEVLAKVLRNSLKLLSLFMPFLAEHLWQKIGERSLLLLEDLPD
jgi:valyl-tRNA synthetase